MNIEHRKQYHYPVGSKFRSDWGSANSGFTIHGLTGWGLVLGTRTHQPFRGMLPSPHSFRSASKPLFYTILLQWSLTPRGEFSWRRGAQSSSIRQRAEIASTISAKVVPTGPKTM